MKFWFQYFVDFKVNIRYDRKQNGVVILKQKFKNNLKKKLIFLKDSFTCTKNGF